MGQPPPTRRLPSGTSPAAVYHLVRRLVICRRLIPVRGQAARHNLAPTCGSIVRHRESVAMGQAGTWIEVDYTAAGLPVRVRTWRQPFQRRQTTVFSPFGLGRARQPLACQRRAPRWSSAILPVLAGELSAHDGTFSFNAASFNGPVCGPGISKPA